MDWSLPVQIFALVFMNSVGCLGALAVYSIAREPRTSFDKLMQKTNSERKALQHRKRRTNGQDA